MAWQISVGGRNGGPRLTRHYSAEHTHALHVQHDPSPDAETSHQVSLHEGSDSAIFEVRRGEPTVRGFNKRDGGFAEVVHPPSEDLKTLIAVHHQRPDRWSRLLDTLQEEYPQLHEAIEAHHAARRSSDAAQYARAYADATATKR